MPSWCEIAATSRFRKQSLKIQPTRFALEYYWEYYENTMKSYSVIKYSGLYLIPYLWAAVLIQPRYEVEMVQTFLGFDPI